MSEFGSVALFFIVLGFGVFLLYLLILLFTPPIRIMLRPLERLDELKKINENLERIQGQISRIDKQLRDREQTETKPE